MRECWPGQIVMVVKSSQLPLRVGGLLVGSGGRDPPKEGRGYLPAKGEGSRGTLPTPPPLLGPNKLSQKNIIAKKNQNKSRPDPATTEGSLP